MAAGLGFKTFTTGEVLTAGDTNGYLMQGILVFATEAARNAAITVPAEGQFAFTKDTNSTWYYDGVAWVASGSSSPLTTKGDVYTFSTVDARLAVGANDTILTADSTTATGLKWAAGAAGGGMILLSTTSLTGATTTIAGINQTYKSLVMVIFGVTNATANGVFRMQPNANSAICSYVSIDSAGASFTSSVQRVTNFNLGGNAYDRTVSTNAATVRIDNYTSATNFKPINAYGFANEGGGSVMSFNIGGAIVSNSAITSLVFSNAGGNLSTGTVLLYGVN